MLREFELYPKDNLSGKNLRLYKEWGLIDQRCSRDEQINYIIRKHNGAGLPVTYDLTFFVKSIIGVTEPDEHGLQHPVFGNRHTLRINLPNNYPSADGQPDFKFTSPVWHPNIRFFGDFKGRVCLNFADSGVYTNLIEYADRIIDYLMYKDYFAKNEYPYPEDLEVAKWVLEQGEPQGWLNFEQ